MQDSSSLYSQMNNSHPQFPEPEQLKCPRCDSSNTKFCYYNNYNLSQPRHFCKSCKRYWTKGGTLRNIPVGGGTRKNTKRSSGDGSAAPESKRPAPAPAPASASNNSNNSNNNDDNTVAAIPESYKGHFGNFVEESGSFGSLLGSSGGQFGNLDPVSDPAQLGNLESGNSNTGDSDRFLNIDGWSGGGNGWPDLAIYTPGSNFQQ